MENSIQKRLAFVTALLISSLTFFGQPVIAYESKISGLIEPLDVVNAGDGSGRFFIVQKTGAILVYSSSFASLGTFVTVSGIQSSGSEEGLLSVAFHPDYETNGYFWVYYVNSAGNLELARYQNPTPSDNVAEGAKQVILTIPHLGQSNHNGGKLNFGADGFLYLSTGDGGGAGDPDNSAQLGNNLLGKMLRLNVTTGGTASYTIPPTNPFLASTGDPGGTIMDEIFSLGLRNPFRWSFDAAGNMWIGDVGQDAWEEIDRISNASGLNFGWRCYEGNANFNNPMGCIAIGTNTFPIYQYQNPPAGAAAVTGGMVYNGTDYPELAGWYYSADVYSGDFHMINTTTFANAIQDNVVGLVTGFGQGEDGELYFLSLDGNMYQLLPASALPVELADFSATAATNKIQTTWRTVSEQDVKEFVVQYSSDRTHFTDAGVVAATNNPNGASYSFDHNTLTRIRTFYRLKMVDLDGSFSYSRIVSVEPLQKVKDFVHPSVITGGVLYVNAPAGYNTFELITMTGQVVKRQSLPADGMLEVAVGGLTTGIYIARLQGQRLLTQKVLIK